MGLRLASRHLKKSMKYVSTPETTQIGLSVERKPEIKKSSALGWIGNFFVTSSRF